MARSSEDVLLQMGEVRYKKGDGTLYVMSERLAWIADNCDTVAVSHRFAEIKSQKISPDGKPKVQLQVVLHDGNTSTFHFVNCRGTSAMLRDREKVKELLQRLLPNFKSKVNKELEKKKQLLQDFPCLLQLYKDLVVTKVMSSEEFWLLYGKQYTQKTKVKDKQSIGISAGFLVEMKPQEEDYRGYRYNLTNEGILSIFKAYPAVKIKYSEYVPGRLSESEFWTKFFQSHYFHRDRLIGVSKDIFAECGRMDEIKLREAVKAGPEDKLLDINAFEDIQLEEGFLDNFLETDKTSNVVHKSMIKHFNQHSTMVLHTSSVLNRDESKIFAIKRRHEKWDKDLENKIIENFTTRKKHKNYLYNSELLDNTEHDSNLPDSTTDIDKSIDSAKNIEIIDADGESNGNQLTKEKLMNRIVYDDLGNPALSNVEDKEKERSDRKMFSSLNMSRKIKTAGASRYLRAPMSDSTFEYKEGLRHMDDMNYTLISLTETWKKRNKHCNHLSSTAAVNALGDLSPGGALMRSYHDQQGSAHQIPQEFASELRLLYITVSELLKPFYKQFPLFTKDRRTTAKRLSEALTEFKKVKVENFEERILQKLSPVGATLTQHLNSLIETAQRKYTKFQEPTKRYKVVRAIVQSREKSRSN